MEAVLEVVLKSLISLGSLAGILLIVLGLPGNWLLALLGLAGVALGVGWPVFFLLLAGAVVAEIAEFLVGLGMARKYGAGRSGMWGAFLGGLAGGILGAPFLPPLGTLAGAGLGAFGGALLLEIGLARRGGREGVRAGTGAFLGVLFGRIFKLWLGFAQAAWLILTLWGFMNGAQVAD